MNIDITKITKDTDVRKAKLLKLKGVNVNVPINFKWQITPNPLSLEERNSQLLDFQLFCIKITTNIFQQKFSTDQTSNDSINNLVKNLDHEIVVENLNKLENIIKQKH